MLVAVMEDFFNAFDNVCCVVVLFYLQEQWIVYYWVVEQLGRIDWIAVYYIYFGVWIENVDGIK